MSDDLMNEIAAAKDKSSIITVVGRRRGRRQRREPHVEPRHPGRRPSWSATPTQQALDNSPRAEREGAASGREGLGAGNDPENGRQRRRRDRSPDIRRSSSRRPARGCSSSRPAWAAARARAHRPSSPNWPGRWALLTVGHRHLAAGRRGRRYHVRAGLPRHRGAAAATSIRCSSSTTTRTFVEIYGRLSLKQAFGKADDILASAAKGIAEIITVESDHGQRRLRRRARR